MNRDDIKASAKTFFYDLSLHVPQNLFIFFHFRKKLCRCQMNILKLMKIKYSK